MQTLNLGILAHVDAGKTTLTERLLFNAGAIDHVGSVDAGTTQTDSLDLERERGITIRSAVASFLLGDLAVNLVDTPGHPDFIAEVERVLGVLDGAVLVVSAVEGVQPQTPLLFRALRRLGVPTADLRQQDRSGGRRRRPGSRGDEAAARPGWSRWARSAASGRGQRCSSPAPRRRGLSGQPDRGARRARRRGPAGLRRRWAGPPPPPPPAARRADRGPPAPPGLLRLGRGPAPASRPLAGITAPAGRDGRSRGGRLRARLQDRANRVGRTRGLVRMFDGTLRPRQRVRVGGGDEAQVDLDQRVRPDRRAPPRLRRAGEMATVWGLGAVRVGDTIGEPPAGQARARPALPAADARGRRLRPPPRAVRAACGRP